MNLLLIGSKHFSPDFCAYANQRNINLLNLCDKRLSDITYLKSLSLNEVISFSDHNQLIVEHIKKKIKIPGRCPSLIKTLTNKALMRKSQHISSLLPKSLMVDPETSTKEVINKLDSLSMTMPLVIKPSHGFYSSGVTRIDSYEELHHAIQIAKRINMQLSNEKGKTIIEEYLDGEEIAIDGTIINGTVYPLLKHHKHPTLTGPYFHEEAYISEVLSSEFDEKLVLLKFIKTIGLQSGPFHLEMRKRSNGEWVLLECAPRYSGMGLSTNLPYYLLTQKNAYDFLFGEIPPKRTQQSEERVVEFDFSVLKSGILTGLTNITKKIKALYDCKIFQYANDGDYVLSPPENMNTILTVFHKVNSHNEAISFYNHLSSFKQELIQ